MPGRNTDPAPAPDLRPYVPIAILSLAFLVGILQQTFVAFGIRSELVAARVQQQATYDQALNFRHQLEGIAADTAKLAADGDPAAQAIEDALRQQGLTFPFRRDRDER
jgi:hypothetical protein